MCVQVLCAAGRFSPAGVGVCAPCPSGTYAPAVGAEACVNCPSPNLYSPMASLSVAACQCPPGHSCIGSTPLACPEDSYSLPREGRCMVCPDGMRSPPGSDTCLPACPTVMLYDETYVACVLRNGDVRSSMCMRVFVSCRIRTFDIAVCACLGLGFTVLPSSPTRIRRLYYIIPSVAPWLLPWRLNRSCTSRSRKQNLQLLLV